MIKDKWRKNYTNSIVESVSSEFVALVKLHSELAKATFRFFEKNGIEYIPVPATTSAVSSPMEPGSDSEPVEIKVKNSYTRLTDSAQFYLEYGCRSWQKGCFYYGHSFRDEETDYRHLAQFSHAEAEISGTLKDVKQLVEQYIKYITESIWVNAEEYLTEVPDIKQRIDQLLNNREPFKSISFDEASKLLKESKDALKKCGEYGYRLTPLGEKMLLDKMGNFVWIEKLDKMTVPFYQAVDKKNRIAFNADLLFGIGEVVGAGQRHVYAIDLEHALLEHGLSIRDYEWYVEMKRKYPMQTAGFGMGVERYLMWLLGIKDIRDVEVFARNRLQIGVI